MSGRTAAFFWVAVPKSLGGVLMLLLNALLLRFLQPDSFGVFTLCLSGILIVDAVIGSAFDMGVLRLAPQYRGSDVARAIAVEKASLLLKCGLAAFGIVLVAVFSRPLGQAILHDWRLGDLLVISAAGAFTLLFLRSVLVYLQVREEFVLYGKIELLHSVFKYGGTALFVVLLSSGVTEILLLFAVAPVVATLVILPRYLREVLTFKAEHAGAAQEVVGHVKWFLLTFGLAALVGRIDLYLITALSDLKQVGLFSGAQVFVMIPEMLGTYLAVVLSPRVMPLLAEGRFYQQFKRVQLALLITAAAGMALAFPVVKLLGPFLLPVSYADSAELVLILLPGALASFVTFPLTLPFLMFRKPRLLFTVDAVTAPLLIVVYVVMIGDHGAAGAAWVTSGSRVIKAGIAQAFAWHLARGAGGSVVPAAEKPAVGV